MHPTGPDPSLTNTRRLRVSLMLAALSTTAVLGACSGTSSGSTADPGGASTTSAGQVLPVSENPITNTATAETLAIDSVLVENNEDASGTVVDDHLEIALDNSGTVPLTTVEVYYTFNDPKTSETESYYLALPSDFTIPAGGTRVAHFDNTGAADHFPVNEFSLYSTDTNALDVSVVVSADGAAPVTAEVKKDAGGAETAD